MSKKSNKGQGGRQNQHAVPTRPPQTAATSQGHATMSVAQPSPAQGRPGGSGAVVHRPAPAPAATARAQDVAQQRAAHAWAVIDKAKALPDKAPKHFGGHAKKLPMRIRAAGLGQALAFVRAKAKPNGDKEPGLVLLLEALGLWVLPRLGRNEPPASDALLGAILHGDSVFLRRATLETLAYLEWLNRFAEAEGLGDDIDTDKV